MRESRISSFVDAARGSVARWSRRVRFGAAVLAGLSVVSQWGAGAASAQCLGGACHIGHLHHFAKRHPVVVPYCPPVVLPYCAPALHCAPTVRVVRVVAPVCSPCSPALTYGCGSVHRVVKVVRVKKVVRVPSCGARVAPSCGQPATRQVVQPAVARPILPIASWSDFQTPAAGWGGWNGESSRIAVATSRGGEGSRGGVLGSNAADEPSSASDVFRFVSFSREDQEGSNSKEMLFAAEEELPAQAVRVERAKPGVSPLRPGEGVWDASAIGILDDLVRRGDFAAALQSCESMAKNAQGMSKGVALRHAVLKLFAPDSESELSAVLDLLNTACAAGSKLQGEELGVGTLRGFLESTPVSLDESLNQFSRLTLENPEIAVGNLLLISALLKLDGQEDRSRVFAEEAFERASQTGELNWSSLLMTLRR